MNGTNSNGTSPSTGSQLATDQALASNIVINVILAIIFFILYLISKHFRPRLYQWSDVRPPMYHKLAWMRPLISCPSSSIIQTHGMDVYTYLLFLWMCYRIVIALSLFGLIVMMPINGTGTNKYLPAPNQVSGTSVLSLANVDPNDNLRLSFHLIAVLFNTFIFCFFLYMFTKTFLKYRVKVKRSYLLQNYTVGITGYTWKHERLYQFFPALFPERINSMHVVPDIPKLDALHDRRFKLVLEKEAAVVKNRKKKGPDHVSKTVTILDNKIKKIDQKLDNLVNQPSNWNDYPITEQMKDMMPRSEKVGDTKNDSTPTNQKKKNKIVEIFSSKSNLPSYTNTTYATFRSMGDAHLCSRMITGSSPKWYVFPAPDPTEIYWRNHTPNVGSYWRSTLFIIGIILNFLLILFWIIPVGFATGLANLQTIGSIPGLGWLATFIGINATVKSIISGILPQLVITIFFIILVPLIVLLVQKFFLPLNRMEKVRSVITIYFAFEIVNIYAAGLLSNSFWSIIDQLELIAEYPMTLANLLGTAVPAQAIFFINYIIVAALRSSLLALWKPGALVSEGLGRCCLASTPRDYRDLYRAEEFSYVVSYPSTMFVLVLILCYANIAPLILPFGFLYFVFMLLTETHRLLYVCRPKSLGQGMVWFTMFNQCCFAVGLYGVTMLGVFALKKFVAGIVISILVVVFIIIFICEVNKRLYSTAYYGSYDSMVKHNRMTPEIQTLYVHPSLLPVAQDKLEYYGDMDETVQVPHKKPPSPENDKLSEMNSENGSEIVETRQPTGSQTSSHNKSQTLHNENSLKKNC